MALGTGHWVWVWVWRKAHNKAIFKTRVVSRIAHHGSPISHLSSLISHHASRICPFRSGKRASNGRRSDRDPLGELFFKLDCNNEVETWSGKRDSNSRPQPWQGCALPLSYSRKKIHYDTTLLKKGGIP